MDYIVTCRRGGVSNKPPRTPGSDKTRGQGSFGPFTGGLYLTLPKNYKKKNGPYTGPVLLRQGETGTSQYIEKTDQGLVEL